MNATASNPYQSTSRDGWENIHPVVQERLLEGSYGDVQWMAQYPGLAEAVQSKIVEAYEEDVNEEALRYLVKNPAMTRTVQQQSVLKIGGAWRSPVAEMVLDTDLHRWVYDQGEQYWAGLAGRRDLDPEVRSLIKENGTQDEGVVKAFALTTTNVEEQKEFLASNNSSIQGALAQNPAVCEEVAHNLTRRNNHNAHWVAEYTTNPKILAWIVDNNEDTQVLASAASNPILTVEQQEKIARDRRKSIPSIAALCRRRDLSLTVQEIILGRDDVLKADLFRMFKKNMPSVHSDLRGRLKGWHEYEGYLASSPEATVQDLERIAAEGLRDERLAARKDLPQHLHDALMEKDEELFASHSNDQEFLRYLIEDGLDSERRKALSNPNLIWVDEDLVSDVWHYNPRVIDQLGHRPGVDTETWFSLAPKWNGTIGTLTEACGLV